MDVSATLWAATIGLILLMLAVDLFAHRHASVISVKEAALWSTLWVSLGIGFGVYLWFDFGPEIGQKLAELKSELWIVVRASEYPMPASLS